MGKEHKFRTPRISQSPTLRGLADLANHARYDSVVPIVSDRNVFDGYVSRLALDNEVGKHLTNHPPRWGVGTGDYLEPPHGEGRLTNEKKKLHPLEPILSRHIASRSENYQLIVCDSGAGEATTMRRMALRATPEGAQHLFVATNYSQPPIAKSWETLPNFRHLVTEVGDLPSRSLSHGFCDGMRLGQNVDILIDQYGPLALSMVPEDIVDVYVRLLRPGGVMLLSGFWPSNRIVESEKFSAKMHPSVTEQRQYALSGALANLVTKHGYTVSVPSLDGKTDLILRPPELTELRDNPRIFRAKHDLIIMQSP